MRNPDWPVPPDVADPRPPEVRRAWGKLPHEERYRRQRRDLLRAAARLVSERGYEGTRIADIVSEAGLSKVTFYEHFASKEECFLELYRRTNRAMLRAGIAAAEEMLDRGPHATLLAVVRALTGYVARDPRLAEAMRAELAAGRPAIQAQRRENLRRIANLFVVIARRIGSDLPEHELHLVAAILVHGVTATLPERPAGADLDEELDAIARMGCRALGVPAS